MRFVTVASLFVVQFLAAKYALIFMQGYQTFSQKSDEQSTALSCAHIAAFLILFAGDFEKANMIYERLLAFTKDEYNYELSSLSQMKMSYRNLMKRISDIIVNAMNNNSMEIFDYRQFSKIEPYQNLELYIANMIYGRKYMPTKDLVLKHKTIWNLAGMLSSTIQSAQELAVNYYQRTAHLSPEISSSSKTGNHRWLNTDKYEPSSPRSPRSPRSPKSPNSPTSSMSGSIYVPSCSFLIHVIREIEYYRVKDFLRQDNTADIQHLKFGFRDVSLSLELYTVNDNLRFFKRQGTSLVLPGKTVKIEVTAT